MNIPPKALKPKPGFSCYPNGVPPSLAWVWTATNYGESIVGRRGTRLDVCPGMRAEVTDPTTCQRFDVYALGKNVQRGNFAAAEERVQKEGGPADWCKKSGGTVSAPCINKYNDGGDQTFIVMAHPVKTVQASNKKTYLKPEVYADIAGVPVEFFTPEPPCTCKDINLPHSSDCPWKQWKDKK